MTVCLSVHPFVRVRFASEELPNISVVKSKREESAEHLAENINKPTVDIELHPKFS